MRKILFALTILSSACFAFDPIFDEIAGEDNSKKILAGSYKNESLTDSPHQWRRYKANFGMEKIFLSFPQKPVISQSYDCLTAYTYDRVILYTFSGYFPAIGNIDHKRWFAETLETMNTYPYKCLVHKIYRNETGDWVLDYTSQNYAHNLIVKTRAIVTPFNAYTLQCTKPIYSNDVFGYYLEKFAIHCECKD